MHGQTRPEGYERHERQPSLILAFRNSQQRHIWQQSPLAPLASPHNYTKRLATLFADGE
jgi:hypothetical protein